MGQTHGHSTAAGAFSVAATPAAASFSGPNPGPYPGAFTTANKVETFSSDGPRRLFYNANGTPFTPGNLSSTGGLVRQKPDITAADGVQVTGVGGFPTTFYGTSASAPHAAAIAALLKQARPAATPAQIRTWLTSSALDIETAGVDRDAGAGIVMPVSALIAAGVPGSPVLTISSFTAEENPGNSDGMLYGGEGGRLTVGLTNIGFSTATAIEATLTTTTPGVTITAPATRTYPNLAAAASANGGIAVHVHPANQRGVRPDRRLHSDRDSRRLLDSGGVLHFGADGRCEHHAGVRRRRGFRAADLHGGRGTADRQPDAQRRGLDLRHREAVPGIGGRESADRLRVLHLHDLSAGAAVLRDNFARGPVRVEPAAVLDHACGSFNPNNLSIGYAGDAGQTYTDGGFHWYGVNLGAGSQTFIVASARLRRGRRSARCTACASRARASPPARATGCRSRSCTM